MNLVELLVALIFLVVGLMVGFCWGVFEGAKRTKPGIAFSHQITDTTRSGLIPVRAARLLLEGNNGSDVWERRWILDDLKKHIEPYVLFQTTEDPEGCGVVLRATLWVADKGVK